MYFVIYPFVCSHFTLVFFVCLFVCLFVFYYFIFFYIHWQLAVRG